jgi:Protein of unknown function (DUF2855)
LGGVPELLVRRDDLRSCRLVEGEPQERDLAEGEAELLVERFSLSSNNISYAVMGEQLGYWRIFPGARRQGAHPRLGLRRA